METFPRRIKKTPSMSSIPNKVNFGKNNKDKYKLEYLRLWEQSDCDSSELFNLFEERAGENLESEVLMLGTSSPNPDP